MVNRMMRAVQADVSLYEEAEHTPALQQEAYTIVGVVAAISAVFTLLWALIGGTGIVGSLLQAVVAGVMAFVGYLIWSYLTFFIGTRVFEGKATVGEVQRALGYAWTPQILSQLLAGIPILGCLSIVPGLWSLYLGFIATRQSLDLDNQKTLITVVGAFIVQFVITAIVFAVVGVGGALLGGLTGN